MPAVYVDIHGIIYRSLQSRSGGAEDRQIEPSRIIYPVNAQYKHQPRATMFATEKAAVSVHKGGTYAGQPSRVIADSSRSLLHARALQPSM